MTLNCRATRNETVGPRFEDWKRSNRFEDLDLDAAILKGFFVDGIAFLSGFELGPFNSVCLKEAIHLILVAPLPIKFIVLYST